MPNTRKEKEEPRNIKIEISEQLWLREPVVSRDATKPVKQVIRGCWQCQASQDC